MAASSHRARRIPKLCRHKATGQAVVRLNGQDVYCGKFGTAAAKAEYDRVITEWLQRGRAMPGTSRGQHSRDCPAEGLSVAEVILAYKAHCDSYYRHSPLERERVRLSVRPLRQLYGLTPAAGFGPLAFKAVREKMLEPQRRTVAVRNTKQVQVGERVVEYRLGRRTINQRMDAIRRMFAWAVENELVPAAVHHGLAAVKPLRAGRSAAREPRKVGPVPEAHVAAVLALVSAQVRAMIEVQRLTGMRSDEVCRMRPADIDTSGTVWVYRPTRFKGQHREGAARREVLLGPQAQAVLVPFLRRPADAYLFSPAEAAVERFARLRAARRSKVPPSQVCRKKARPKRKPGGRYTPNSYRHSIVTACRKAGVPRWHPHQLRHLAATVIRRGHGVEVARVLLGHASGFTTEIYAEQDRLKAAEVIRQIG
ncbi:MAG TPA: tyrosine-type recombinase/integrase [Fimbriiglobus sp.]|nr:tyrosine-type recombinase/integrase [Fimbriiglobus sp.]